MPNTRLGGGASSFNIWISPGFGATRKGEGREGNCI